MKTFIRIFTVAILASLNTCLFAQQSSPVLSVATKADSVLDRIKNNTKINADSTFQLLSNWSNYPQIAGLGQDYLYYYTDPFYGRIPLRVFIPNTYKSDAPNSCILLLHGGVGGVTFKDIDTASKFDDLIFSLLKNRTSIIIRPVADGDKKFDWVVDRSRGNTNLTFKVLSDIIVSLKTILNIDDNKVFAFGHSDGSDGAVAMGVYKPDQFAGIIAYNSMLTELFAKDYYIRNIVNRPLYIVHSDLDELRPIQQNRVIIKELSKTDNDIIYKEYIGYQHYDKHLDKDIPFTIQFINAVSRNPFKTHVIWEASSINNYNACDWLRVTGINTELSPAAWYTHFTMASYNKQAKKFEDRNYYSGLNSSAVVNASFNNNVFNIQTSGTTEIELMISPVMVNLEEPVIVVINGKQAFSGKVIADKKFIIDGFQTNFDRQAIWVTSLKLKVE